MTERIAIVVVLYNDLPKGYVFKEKEHYVILVDNTPRRNLGLHGQQLTYIPLGDNLGIAKALNIGFQKAKEFGVKWVLTMDQDSELPENMISEYFEFLKGRQEKIGVVSPLKSLWTGDTKTTSDTYFEIEEAMTSGSLTSVEAFDAVSGFREELFIDYVDSFFCYDIRSLGYKVYQLNRVLMQHQWGNGNEISFWGHYLCRVSNYECSRHYYLSRNLRSFVKAYGDSIPIQRLRYVSEIKQYIKILLFEKEKFRKIKARILGARDYYNGHFGRLEHKI